MAAYHVVWECVVEQWLGVRRMLSNKRLKDLGLSKDNPKIYLKNRRQNHVLSV